MVKDLTINVRYNNKSKRIRCQKEEIEERLAECFDIDINDVILYHVLDDNKRNPIRPSNILDYMSIEMTHKDGQRNLRSYFVDHLTSTSFLQGIKAKLGDSEQNFNEKETVVLRNILDQHIASLSKKRKLDERDGTPENNRVSHKKVQVNVSSLISKDAFSQTDSFINIILPSKNTTEETIEKMKQLAEEGDQNKQEIEELMTASFDERRTFIFVKIPPVISIKEKYPLLFSLDEVKNELDRIFSKGRCAIFLSNVEKYSKILIQDCEQKEEICQLTMKSVAKARTPLQKTYTECVGSIFILAHMLDKGFRFIHLSDQAHGSIDIYPHIDASVYTLKDVFAEGCTFRIMVEGQELCETNSFPDAILCLIASFFIFNIDYPEACRNTLIAFEKLYLCANDTKDIDINENTHQMIKFFELKAVQKKNKQ